MPGVISSQPVEQLRAAVGYYGLDFFARPFEIKLLRRAHLLPASQMA